MQILITNYALAWRTGTELYVRDLAGELARRGHQPIIYTPRPGAVSDELRQQGLPVVTDLAEAEFSPDVIHGHHWQETMAAVLRFPDVPAVSFCHDATVWHDRAPIHPNIRRYLAVDLICRDRLLKQGIDAGRVQLMMNFVDLRRFQPRGPLPERPKRALLFSNYSGHIAAVREACRLAGLKLDVLGNAIGRPTERPEELLGQYDLVFARARAAIEAMAVGTAVVLCDHWGCGVMVTAAELDRLRPLNFGRSTLTGPLDAAEILKQIRRYDPRDAGEVSQRIRSSATLEQTVGQLLQVYQEIREDYLRHKPAVAEQGRAAARYLKELLEGGTEQQALELASVRTRVVELENSLPVRMKEALVRLPLLGSTIRTLGRTARKFGITAASR